MNLSKKFIVFPGVGIGAGAATGAALPTNNNKIGCWAPYDETVTKVKEI